MTQIEINATNSEAKRELKNIEDRVNRNMFHLERLNAKALSGLALQANPKNLSESLDYLISHGIEKLTAAKIKRELAGIEADIGDTKRAIERARKDPDLDSVSLKRDHQLTFNSIGSSRQINDITKEIRELNTKIEGRSGVKENFSKISALRSLIAQYTVDLREWEVLYEQSTMAIMDRHDPALRDITEGLSVYRSKLGQASSDLDYLAKIVDIDRSRFFGVESDEKSTKLKDFFASRGTHYLKDLEASLKLISAKVRDAWKKLGLDKMSEDEISDKFRKDKDRVNSVKLDKEFYLQLGYLVISVAVIWGIFVGIRKLSKRAYMALMRGVKRAREKYGWLPGKKVTPQVAKEISRHTMRLPAKDQMIIRKVVDDARAHKSKYKSIGSQELRKREASIQISSRNVEILDIPFNRVYDAISAGNLSLTEVSLIISEWTSTSVECIASNGAVYFNGEGINQVMIASSYGHIVVDDVTLEIEANSSLEDILLEWESMQWED